MNTIQINGEDVTLDELHARASDATRTIEVTDDLGRAYRVAPFTGYSDALQGVVRLMKFSGYHCEGDDQIIVYTDRGSARLPAVGSTVDQITVFANHHLALLAHAGFAPAGDGIRWESGGEAVGWAIALSVAMARVCYAIV